MGDRTLLTLADAPCTGDGEGTLKWCLLLCAAALALAGCKLDDGAPCTSPRDCASAVCFAGACGDAADGLPSNAAGAGQECLFASDSAPSRSRPCAAGLECIVRGAENNEPRGICGVTLPTGSPCTTEYQCADGSVCDGALGVCALVECGGDSACAVNERCRITGCPYECGATCVTPREGDACRVDESEEPCSALALDCGVGLACLRDASDGIRSQSFCRVPCAVDGGCDVDEACVESGCDRERRCAARVAEQEPCLAAGATVCGVSTGGELRVSFAAACTDGFECALDIGAGDDLELVCTAPSNAGEPCDPRLPLRPGDDDGCAEGLSCAAATSTCEAP